MIRIFLPNNFGQDKDIFSIYTDIAEKIYQGLDGLKLKYIKEEVCGELSTIDDIREFLLAKDFYKYTFLQKNDKSKESFFYDLYIMRGNIIIKSCLTGENTKSEDALNFYKKYSGLEFKEQRESLSQYKDDSVKECKEKGFLVKPKNYLDLREYFNYEKYINGDVRNTILHSMGVFICPYCNMNYTVEYDYENKKRSTADIDHFYLKSVYPEYALCLYNFIPSCPVCNSKLKSTKSMNVEEYVYPHENSMEGKAKFQIDKIEECFLDPNLKPKITLNNYSGDSRVDKSSELFKTNEIYANFSDYAKDILQNSIRYNYIYRNELKEIIHSQYELKEMIFGANKTEEEYSKESLGKLRMDLLKQLGVY